MRALRIHPDDNVAVALEAIPSTATVFVSDCQSSIVASDRIEFGHKISLEPIAEGSAVRKYGVPIGFATQPIPAGAWVHTHNAKSYFVSRREQGER
jgi:altronate hydrolase